MARWSLTAIGFGALLLSGLVACSSSTEPPIVGSEPGGFGGSTAEAPPCPQASVDAGSGTFNLDAGLGIGTTNPITPPEAGIIPSGDATVAPTVAVDAGTTTPCP